MKFLSILVFGVAVVVSLTKPRNPPTALTYRGTPVEVVNEKWAGVVVEQPASEGLTSIEGTFKVPEGLNLSDGAPDGYNLVSIFVGLGDGDNLPQLVAGITLSAQKKAGVVTPSHFAHYTLSSASPSTQLTLSDFSFNLNDTLRLSITSTTLTFENFSTNQKFTKDLNITSYASCRNRPCPPVKRSTSTTGETGFWIVEEAISPGEEFGNFGVLEWKGASGNTSTSAKVEAGVGDRWVIADSNGTKVMEVAVITPENFQVGLVANLA